MQQVGKYQLIRKLATGGMAEVFLAKAAGPMGFEKTLVLKRILPHLAEEPAFVQMFLTEAKLAARLTHPHIVQIFDFGEADGAYFLAMEYIDGPSLRTLIKDTVAQGQTLPPELCARLVSQACEGLAFAHDFMDPETGEAQGLVHRDISPDNILLSRQGAVKVVDFGIAKAAGQSHKTESGVIKGKLAYMPPEQLRAKALDRRVDVYALGVVLYELLTGRKPYVSDSDVGLMQAIIFEEPTPAAQLRSGLPPRLSGILERALAKDREQRYPDCHALQSDLEEFIVSVGKPVTAQQVAQIIVRAASRPELPVVPPNVGKRVARPNVEEAATQATKVERPTSGAHPTLDLHRASTPLLSVDPAQSPPSNKKYRHWLGGVGTLAAGVLILAGSGFVHRQAPRDTPPQVGMAVRPPIAEPPSTPAPSPPPLRMPSIDDAGARSKEAVAAPSNDAIGRPPKPALASAAELSPAPTKEEGNPTLPLSSGAREDRRVSPEGPPKAVVKEPAREAADPKRLVQVPHKIVPMGILELHTQPDTIVAVDGKEKGVAPMVRIKLSAGVHHIQLDNQKLSKFWFDTVKVEPNQLSVLEVDLRKY